MALKQGSSKGKVLSDSFDVFRASWLDRRSTFRFKEAEISGNIYAILVGIDRYGYGMLGKEFTGCINDIRSWQELLKKHDTIEYIASFLDTNATKVAIVEALQYAMGHLRSQDTLLFIFSGHAHNGDSPHALATYDSIAAQKETYLSETEFRKLISSPKSRNPFIVVILDTHAGNHGWIDIGNNKQVLFAASSSGKLAEEVNGRGLFTTALQNILKENEQISYRKLMHDTCRYTKQLLSRQLPQLFGHINAINQVFLGGSSDPTIYINELLKYAAHENIEVVLKNFQIEDQNEIIGTLEKYAVLNAKETLKVVRISSKINVHKIPIFGKKYIKKLPYQIEIEDVNLFNNSNKSGLRDSLMGESIEHNLSALQDAQLIVFILNQALIDDFLNHSSITAVLNYLSRIEYKVICSIVWEDCNWNSTYLTNYPVFSSQKPLSVNTSGYEAELEIKNFYSSWKPVREKWSDDLLKDEDEFYAEDLKFYNPPAEIEEKGRELEYDINLTYNESWSFLIRQLQKSEILVGRFKNQVPAEVAAHIYSRDRLREIEKSWWPIDYFALDKLIFQRKDKSKKKVFIAYSHEDTSYRLEAEKFLRNLEGQNPIEVWHDGLLEPANSWDDVILGKLAEADIVIFLVSQAFINSTDIFEKEMSLALKNAADRNIKIIPVLLKSFDWKNSELVNYQFLPVDEFGQVTPLVNMANQEDAWMQLAMGIRDYLDSQQPDYFQRKIKKIYSEKKIIVRDDLQKFRWGGGANANGYSLGANVEKTALESAVYKVNINIKSSNQNDSRQVAFFLHNTFLNEIRFYKFQGNTVDLEVTAYEAFTVGAYIEDGTELELDLMEQPGFPIKFYYKHNFDVLWLDPDSSNSNIIKTLAKEGMTVYQHESWKHAENTLLRKKFDFLVSSLSLYELESNKTNVMSALKRNNESAPLLLYSDRNYLNSKRLNNLLEKASPKILLIGESYNFLNPVINVLPKNLFAISRESSFTDAANLLNDSHYDLIVSAIPNGRDREDEIVDINKVRKDTPLIFYSGKRSMDFSSLQLLTDNAIVVLNVKIATVLQLIFKIIKEL